MRFRTRVAIQAPIEVRDPAGGVSHDWETIEDLASVAATIMPAVDETRDPELVTVEDRYDIVLAGDHPDVRPEMKREPTNTAQLPTMAKVEIDWRRLKAICFRLNRRSCWRYWS